MAVLRGLGGGSPGLSDGEAADASRLPGHDVQLSCRHVMSPILRRPAAALGRAADTENVAKLIRRKAKDLGSKCVVLARHGKGKMREMWVGSVTKALAAKPPADHIPVIVVPHN